VFKEGKTFLDRLTKGDLGILWISGHGTREKSGSVYHEGLVWAGMDVEWDYSLNGLLRKRDRGSVLVVGADVCHAGGLPRGASLEATKPRTGKRIKAIPFGLCHAEKYIGNPEKLTALPDVIPFLGCQAKEYSYDAWFDGRANGAMTHYAMLSTELKPSETFGQIYLKLAGKRPKGFLPNDEYDQTPVVVASAKNLKRTLGEFRKA